jgi:hypothetical protein
MLTITGAEQLMVRALRIGQGEQRGIGHRDDVDEHAGGVAA